MINPNDKVSCTIYSVYYDSEHGCLDFENNKYELPLQVLVQADRLCREKYYWTPILELFKKLNLKFGPEYDLSAMYSDSLEEMETILQQLVLNDFYLYTQNIDVGVLMYNDQVQRPVAIILATTPEAEDNAYDKMITEWFEPSNVRCKELASKNDRYEEPRAYWRKGPERKEN